MIEYLEGGPIPTKKYHKTIVEQFNLKDKVLYYVKEATDGRNVQRTFSGQVLKWKKGQKYSNEGK